MSITAILFYWRNDTPSFLTWRSRLATAPDTPACIVIHYGQFTGGVHPQNQFVPEIVSPLPCFALYSTQNKSMVVKGKTKVNCLPNDKFRPVQIESILQTMK